MKILSTMGPAGSFTELAAKKFSLLSGEDWSIRLFPSIVSAFEAVGKDSSAGIVPVENMLEGHIMLSLDLLAESELKIIGEIMLPVRFSFVANCRNANEVKKIYIQFVTQGQCRRFLKTLPADVQIITTESNSTSYAEAAKSVPGESAIVPAHMAEEGQVFPLVIPHVHDHPKNMTRFAVIGQDVDLTHEKEWNKTSIVILDVSDEPGALHQILGAFEKEKLNLSSILSRPNKMEFGKYHFFMDIEAGYPNDPGLKRVLDFISVKNRIKILGSYRKAEMELEF